jgi:hypothetical protein
MDGAFGTLFRLTRKIVPEKSSDMIFYEYNVSFYEWLGEVQKKTPEGVFNYLSAIVNRVPFSTQF